MALLILQRSFRRSFFISPICNPRFFSTSISATLYSPNLVIPCNRGAQTRFVSSCANAEVSEISKSQNLVHVLETEIECIEDVGLTPKEALVPEGFPFEIIDTPGDQAVVIRQEYAGENIQAILYLNDDELHDEEEDESSGSENFEKSTISMVITICKESKPTLEFCCNLNSDDLDIESIALKKPDESENDGLYWPKFSDLDGSLQMGLRKYLSNRGFKSSLYNPLYEYLDNKNEREYLNWLKDIKEFVGN